MLQRRGNVNEDNKAHDYPSEAEYGKGCRYRMYYAIYRWISGVYDYSHVYIALLFLLRLQYFTAPTFYRMGEF